MHPGEHHDEHHESGISPKVTAGAATSALVAVGVWLAGELGVQVPAEVAVALATLLAAAAGYLKRDPLRDAASRVD
jgi:hypothetical protein